MLFNEQGIIDIDDMIAQQPSFQNIMADGIITEEELRIQSERVIDLFHQAEQHFSEEDQQFIKKLFVETNVLSAIYHYYELQNLIHHGNL